MEESALRPKQMKVDIYGSGNYNGDNIPFPSVYINDALSQNILYYCYEEAHTVEELSKLCGVPAYYIEERMENLVKHEAVLEPAKGKYRTDLIIWSDKYGIYSEEHAEKTLMPMIDKLLTALDNIAEEADRLDFHKGGKSKQDLYYLYGVLAFSYLSKHYSRLPYPAIPKRYDGNYWRYIASMETGQHPRKGIGTQMNNNYANNGAYTYSIHCAFAGYTWRPMMSDHIINVCEEILSTGTSKDAAAVADAIQKGYIRRNEDGTFFITVPAFNNTAKEAFDKIVEKHLAPLADEYSRLIANFIAGYKKLFPKHLNDDADRMCSGMFFGLYAVIVEYAQRTGRIEPPTTGDFCEVLMHK